MFMVGCKSGPCPECGGMGSVPDGEYSVGDALIRFLQGPSRSWEKLESLAYRISSMQQQGHPDEEILKEVEAVSPGLANFSKFFSSPLLGMYLGMIVSIGSAIASCSSQAEIEEAVRQGVLGALIQYEDQLPPGEPPLDDRNQPAKKAMDNDDGGPDNDLPGKGEIEDDGSNDDNLNRFI